MISGRPGLPPLTAIERLRRTRADKQPRERCDLCADEVRADHAHLYEGPARRIVCACGPCAILFAGNAAATYRPIPKTVRALPSFTMTDEQWQDLLIPVDIAFFQRSSAAGRVVAFYPSPAGATESLLELDSWKALLAVNPLLGTLAPDVEALLVYRVAGARTCYIVPIDRCYELIGRIRLAWRGLTGGTEVWKEVTTFFEALGAVAVDA